VRLHDQGSGPTGARTAALSASSIPATESDGLSMNQSKTEKEHSGDNYIGKQDREWLADVVSVEVERVSQQQIGVAGQSAPPGRLLAICELSRQVTGQVAGHRSTVQVVRPLRRVVGWAGRSQPARRQLQHRRRSWRCSALARLTRTRSCPVLVARAQTDDVVGQLDDKPHAVMPQGLVGWAGRLLAGWLLRGCPMVKQRASTSGRIVERSRCRRC